MSTEIPLGQRESQRLEFKEVDALKQPGKIAREVVAMLNSEGGEIWVGLREEDGRAVELEPIADAESRKERLLDHLVDVLSPSPTGGELRIEMVELPDAELGEGQVLRILVRPAPNRGPYAWIDRGWHFATRVGARIRPMAREEVFRAPTSGDDIEQAKKALVEERNTIQAKGEPLFWLAVEPVPQLTLELSPAEVSKLFLDPSLTGNRRGGWSFIHPTHQPRYEGEKLVWREEHDLFRLHAEVRLNGGARFELSLSALEWKGLPLWPFTLLEFPISAFRFLTELEREALQPARHDMVADLALFAVGDRRLHPGSPRDPFFGMPHRARSLVEGEDAVADPPLEFSASEILDEPDRCGYRLVRRIYRAFGLDESDIPQEYDRDSGRLILPE